MVYTVFREEMRNDDPVSQMNACFSEVDVVISKLLTTKNNFFCFLHRDQIFFEVMKHMLAIFV